MTTLRTVFRLLCIGICLLYGMAEMFFLFPFYSKQRKLRAIQLWSLRVLASCGLKLETYGKLPEAGQGQMMISNHISWLDIMAVNGAFPGRFVAKDDVAKWPVVGYLATQAQTVYVTRNKGTEGNSEKIRHVTEALKNGDTVTLFPEGTSTEGREILPFKTSFFQAAYEADVPLIPVLCRYPNPDGSSPNPAMAYYGDISLIQSIRMIISQPGGVAELHFLDPVPSGPDRQAIARDIHRRLSEKQRDLG
ncbi:1-acyl-sn-glycerol-3-phosphate acyltransferase [Neisseria dentiae]|uniref:1-acyl-sn-glycerol-3-phosphate acyltransferase n=1 Tax=Neisseria dentiae TaxID=194197 RepID=A0A1X3DDZ1_9NEIS|nr:lysophospholipid acyltransferase family protein [Neisseria dentiae]OSI17934.1 1-acyl-sn-glycerol-3-phosphate acyltransferase [Neisseria dentiae]QMT44589.1 1-acyl-sn-glycerol-3-phosphate acyltransferase [Neisseria dentiae]STZ50294.1 1-acyl-SN-glycerol-3-phosphate acyltransferase [Neisseria dentiae]